MKTGLTLFATFFSIGLLTTVSAQQFVWAKAYDLPHANETAALTIHNNGSVFMLGVLNAPISLPYTGDAYLSKTSASGDIIWQEIITGAVNAGDMAAVSDGVVITGQSNGSFIYQGQTFGPENYFMFVMHINHEGNLIWLHTDTTKYGGHTNIAVDGQDEIAVRTRGQYNISDWILIFNSEGNIINAKQIAAGATLIVDMAYQNGRVYLNGGFQGTASSVLVDTIEIQRPGNKNVGFVLALDSTLTASWVATDTAYNNRDGKIVVSGDAVFAFIEVQRSPFIFHNHLKKYTLSGELLGETEIPMFTTSVTKYPDMAISPEHIAIYSSNAFDFSSHKLMVFDYDLNLLFEKTVDGLSHLYSGQVAAHDLDFYISHVFSGDIDFDGDVTLTHSAEGRLPYIAKLITDETAVGLASSSENHTVYNIYPNPAKQFATIKLSREPSANTYLLVMNNSGQTIIKQFVTAMETQIDLSSLPAGIYHIQIKNHEAGFLAKKLVRL